MLKKLKNFIKIKRVAGIEISLIEDDEYIISFVQLSIKKNSIIVDKCHEGIEKLSDLSDSIDKDLPISITINGRGILNKKSSEKITDPKKAIQSILPNAKVDDFFVQECSANNGDFYSIIRKQLLGDIISKLSELGFSVIKINLGPFIVVNLIPFFKDLYSLTFAGHRFSIKNNSIDEYYYTRDYEKNDDIKIESELIKEGLLIAYATAFQSLIPKSGKISFEIDAIKESKEEYLNKKAFQVLGWSFLLFFLALLMINFLVYNDLKKENTILSGRQTKFKGLMTDLDTLQKRIKEKEEFLGRAGWMSPPQISFYSDRLANSVPSSVLLTDLSVNPIDNKLSKQEKKIIFQPKILDVSGICNRATDLNPWIKNIKEQDWVDKVQIENYTYNNTDMKGSFHMTIYIK